MFTVHLETSCCGKDEMAEHQVGFAGFVIAEISPTGLAGALAVNFYSLCSSSQAGCPRTITLFALQGVFTSESSRLLDL